MPTPSGLPQKGDRVIWRPKGHPEHNAAGTVIRRGSGQFWALYIKWDNGQETCNVDASYYWTRTKELRLEPKAK